MFEGYDGSPGESLLSATNQRLWLLVAGVVTTNILWLVIAGIVPKPATIRPPRYPRSSAPRSHPARVAAFS
jgi:hypothetical protein